MNHFNKKALPAAIGLAFSGGMLAAAGAQAGDLYFGAGGGVALYDLRDNHVTGLLENSSVTPPAGSFNQFGNYALQNTVGTSGSFWNVYAGYRFTPHLGVEAGYFEAGKVDVKSQQVDGPEGFSGGLKVKGIGLWGVGTLPVTQNISVYGKLGAVYRDAALEGDVTEFSTTSSLSSHSYGIGFSLGAGAEWLVWKRLAVRAEWLHVDLSGSSLDILNAGANWRFKL